MSSSVTLRVFIAKKELDDLKAERDDLKAERDDLKAERDDLKAKAAFHEKHCKKIQALEKSDTLDDASQKSGAGIVNVGSDADQMIENLPTFTNNYSSESSDARDGKISEKNILLSGSTSVSVPENPVEKSKNVPVPEEKIVTYIRKRFQKKAMRLLLDIAQRPEDISYNHNGEVTLFGTLFKDSDIKDLVAVTFYKIRSKPITGLTKWIEMLKENNLFAYVENPDLKCLEFDNDWFFIGNLTNT